MATASRLSPKVHMALQHLIRLFFRIESVVAVRLAKSIRKFPAASYADSCALVYYDNDVTPGIHNYGADGAALNARDFTGATRAWSIRH